MLYEKKGLSNIVATVSLILLTFAAVVIVAGIVVPLVRNNLNRGTECFDYEDYFIFEEEFGYNCYNETAGGGRLYAVSVRAKGTGEENETNVKGFKLLFLVGAETRVVEIDEGASIGSGPVTMLNTSISNFEIPHPLEVRTYIYNSNEIFEAAEVYTKLSSGRVCEKGDSIKLTQSCEIQT